MFARFGCLVLLAPIVEILLLVQGIRLWGGFPVLLEVLLTAVLGAWFLRGEGTRALADLQAGAARGETPTTTLLDGASFLTAGFLLFLPGFAGDLLGVALLLPPTRRLLQRWAMARVARQLERGRFQVTFMGAGPPGRGPQGGVWPPPGSGPGREPRMDEGPGPGDDEDRDPPPRPGEIIQR